MESRTARRRANIWMANGRQNPIAEVNIQGLFEIIQIGVEGTGMFTLLSFSGYGGGHAFLAGQTGHGLGTQGPDVKPFHFLDIPARVRRQLVFLPSDLLLSFRVHRLRDETGHGKRQNRKGRAWRGALPGIRELRGESERATGVARLITLSAQRRHPLSHFMQGDSWRRHVTPDQNGLMAGWRPSLAICRFPKGPMVRRRRPVEGSQIPVSR